MSQTRQRDNFTTDMIEFIPPSVHTSFWENSARGEWPRYKHELITLSFLEFGVGYRDYVDKWWVIELEGNTHK